MSGNKEPFQLQIKTLQNAPRYASKLEQIIKAKEGDYGKAKQFHETQRLVTEIEMLGFVLCLVLNGNVHNSSNDTQQILKKL